MRPTIGGGAGYGWYYWQNNLQPALAAMQGSLDQLSADQSTLQQGLQATQGELSAQRRAIDASQKKLAANQQRFDANQKRFQQQEQALQQQQQLLETERRRLQEQGQYLDRSIESLAQRVGASNRDWIAAEAAYLMAVANERLQLTDDRATAIAALQSADQRLQQTEDPGWIEVRR